MRTSIPTKIIRLMMFYLIMTVVYYFIGPIRWATPKVWKLLLFLASAFVSLRGGYWLYMQRHRKQRAPVRLMTDRMIIYYLKYMLIINFVVMTLYFFRNLGQSSFSIANLITWIKNPAAQYSAKFDLSVSGFWGIVGAAATFGSFFLWSTIPLGIYYYKKLPTPYQAMVVANIVVELLRWFAAGTNKGIVDMMLLFMTFMLYRYLNGRVKLNKRARYIILGIVLAVLVLSYFTNSISDRLMNTTRVNYITNPGNQVDPDNWLVKLLPGLKSLFTQTQSYLTQGYYGLALGLEESVVPMWGLGSSDFLIQQAQELFNVDLQQYTYMHRISSALWLPGVNWHSAFLWFANDFGPVGAILYCFAIGYYFAYVVYYLFIRKDPLYFALFCMMIQMIFYLPMNNQIFQTPFSFMGFFGINFHIFLLKKCGIKPVKLIWTKR